jgi:hypothetical protein
MIVLFAVQPILDFLGMFDLNLSRLNPWVMRVMNFLIFSVFWFRNHFLIVFHSGFRFLSQRTISAVDHSVSCEYSKTDSDGFDGIISSLTRKHCGHVLYQDVILITVSSFGSCQSCPLRHIADFENQTHRDPWNEPNSWICSDLKTMEINHTHYSVRRARDGNSNDVRSLMFKESIHYESLVKSLMKSPRSDCDICYFIPHWFSIYLPLSNLAEQQCHE